MSQELPIEIRGLNTNSNQLSKVAKGSLSIAKNIVIDKPGVAEPCRGYAYQANTPTAGTRHDRLTEYKDKLIARRSNNDTLAYYSGGSWTAYSGTYLNPDDDYARMQFLKTSGNLYLTTSTGVKVLDDYVGPVYSTGMPKGLDGVAATTGASGFMADNTQVAYRIVWGTKDANNNLYLGAPSQRIIATNSSGGTRDVAITFTIPSGITVDDFFQIYRSKESASSSDEPNDELQLVYEANPTAGEISALSVSVTDSTSNTLLGASLYTNASQEGLSEANDAPPVAKDLCLFKGYTFFLNIRTKHKLRISLLSVSGSGLVADDTITIDGDVYTAKASETIASGYFKVTTSGSAAQNIEDTAKSLVKVINQYSTNTSIYAYYLSGYQDLPGQILLEKRVVDETQFTVSVSRAIAWDIDDGTSDNEEFINGLMWSKNQQPEHVPSAHLELVGSKNFAARRILALRDSVFILKDDGVFRLTGSNGQWSIDPLDTSTKIIAPDSAVVVNNQIYCLSDQGIVAISDIGVEIKSQPIENQIQELISIDYTKLKTLSFGVNYETDRKYMLWTINSSDDSYPTQSFVYNTITNEWTIRDRPVTHGFVRGSEDKLYFAKSGSEEIYVERKSFDYTDYVEEEITGFNIVSSSGTTVVLDTITNIDVGDILYQSAAILSTVTSVDPASSSVVVNDSIAWSVASATILKAIDCDIEFTNLTADNPGTSKHYMEVAWLFRDKGFLFGTSSFYTDISGGYENTTINGNFGGGSWGSFPWDSLPWGGIQRPKPIRVFVPREKSRGSLISIRLRIRNAYAKWSLNGMSVQFDYVSERMTRE